MKLFSFEPNETGFNSYYVMSDSVDNAIESIRRLTEKYSEPEIFFKNRHKYIIRELDINEVAWMENC
jgi:hypothetical protein